MLQTSDRPDSGPLLKNEGKVISGGKAGEERFSTWPWTVHQKTLRRMLFIIIIALSVEPCGSASAVHSPRHHSCLQRGSCGCHLLVWGHKGLCLEGKACMGENQQDWFVCILMRTLIVLQPHSVIPVSNCQQANSMSKTHMLSCNGNHGLWGAVALGKVNPTGTKAMGLPCIPQTLHRRLCCASLLGSTIGR